MLAVKCFNAETGEELTDTSLSDRMIVIEWSDEHEITEDHTVHFNLVPNKAYETERKRFESEIDTSVDLDVFDGMEGQLTWDHINGAERGWRWCIPLRTVCLIATIEQSNSLSMNALHGIIG